MINKTKTIAAYILSVLVILAAWVFVSKLINAELILPSPLEVFSSMAGLVKTKTFWQAFAHTFLRVIISFAITVVLGTALGIAAGFSKFLRDFFELPLAIIRATPVVAVVQTVGSQFQIDAPMLGHVPIDHGAHTGIVAETAVRPHPWQHGLMSYSIVVVPGIVNTHTAN